VLTAVVLLVTSGITRAAEANAVLRETNKALVAAGADFRVAVAEALATPESPDFEITIIANDRGSKQLDHDFVPFDPRRGGQSNITWAVDQTEGTTTSGLSQGQTNAAIDNAMATWQNVHCSNLPLTRANDLGIDLGVVQNIFAFGGVEDWLADVTHAGWLPGEFFDRLAPGGGDFILGVTFTFIWVNGNGNPTDDDNNGKLDTAFREIYYNDAFSWAVDGVTNIDVESVALHEAGHGLSQGHFGKVFFDNKGRLKFAPKAVMNAVYASPQQSLSGTDNGGHCSIWASWPNN
jgi:hypothetical protein